MAFALRLQGSLLVWVSAVEGGEIYILKKSNIYDNFKQVCDIFNGGEKHSKTVILVIRYY